MLKRGKLKELKTVADYLDEWSVSEKKRKSKEISFVERLRLVITYVSIFFLLISIVGIPFALIIWCLEKQNALKKLELGIPTW